MAEGHFVTLIAQRFIITSRQVTQLTVIVVITLSGGVEIQPQRIAFIGFPVESRANIVVFRLGWIRYAGGRGIAQRSDAGTLTLGGAPRTCISSTPAINGPLDQKLATVLLPHLLLSCRLTPVLMEVLHLSVLFW